MRNNYPYDYISHLVKNGWVQKWDLPIFLKGGNKIVVYPGFFVMVYKKIKLFIKGL